MLHLHITFFSSSCCNILVLASVEVGNHFGSGIPKVPQIVGGHFDGDDDFDGDWRCWCPISKDIELWAQLCISVQLGLLCFDHRLLPTCLGQYAQYCYCCSLLLLLLFLLLLLLFSKSEAGLLEFCSHWSGNQLLLFKREMPKQMLKPCKWKRNNDNNERHKHETQTMKDTNMKHKHTNMKEKQWKTQT